MMAILVACGTSDKTNLGPTSASQNQETAAGDSGAGSDMTGCCNPETMKNVSFTLTDTPTGINVDFLTTQPGMIDRLRMMARHMAGMHSSGVAGETGDHGNHHGGTGGTGSGTGSGGMMGGGHGGMMGGNCTRGDMGDMGMANMFQGAVLEAQDIADGARILFTAQDAGKVNAIRSEVRTHFESMKNGECPMMK
jgi:hypothetical protein